MQTPVQFASGFASVKVLRILAAAVMAILTPVNVVGQTNPSAPTTHHRAFIPPVNRVAHNGPFGFERGMTKEQIIALVGSDKVDNELSRDDVIVLTTAPKPHPAFKEYYLFISPELGLLKLGATGVDINTNVFGNQVHSKFVEIQVALSAFYGKPPIVSFDRLRSGSNWRDPQDWMMGLLKEERVLTALWMSRTTHPKDFNGIEVGSELPNDINVIELEAVALSTTKGYLRVIYEFDGWDGYVDAKKAKQSQTF